MTTQSEYELEQEMIEQLKELGYQYVQIRNEAELLKNLKTQLEKHNHIRLSDDEFSYILTQLKKGGVFEKSKKLRDRIHFYREGEAMPIYIDLLNTKKWCQNEYQVTHQVTIEGQYKNRYDVTLLVNGLPLCQIELKRRGMELKEAYNQIERYQRHSYWAESGLFQFVQLFIISNGINTKYFANDCPSFDFTSFWADENNELIADLKNFTKIFLEPCHLSKMITHYMVLTTEKKMMVLRPYQFYAVEAIMDRIKNSNDNGYIWHTTGSGKTLTSFKASQIIKDMEEVDKVIFVVDRRDLDIQTIREFNQFEKDCVDGTDNTKSLINQLTSEKELVVTTLQKLNNAISSQRYITDMQPLKDKKIVFIFDECHRSQFGDIHKRIVQFFPYHQMIGFTGTPIFEENSLNKKAGLTTERFFHKCLHKYVITDAIADGNVLKFTVDYVKTMEIKKDAKDEEVSDINRDELWLADKRINEVTEYILQQFPTKSKSGKFNAIFCVSSIAALIKYYDAFKHKKEQGLHNLVIATIFSINPNEERKDFDLDDGEVPPHSREKFDEYMTDYNALFGTHFTSKDFYRYNTDISKKVKQCKIDILLVVNMYLTGFDSKSLNTLYVDKNLKYHSLIQAFSRTNRIYNSAKSHGNIICFRNLRDDVTDAVRLFANKDAAATILMQSYEEYIALFNQAIKELKDVTARPSDVIGLKSEQEQLTFVQTFRNLARILNILNSFAEFRFNDVQISEQEFNDYKSAYLDLRDYTKNDAKTSVLKDVDFEIELLYRDEINVDFILLLLVNIQDKKQEDKEKIIKDITDALNNETSLRSKKELILNFIGHYNILESDYDQQQLKQKFIEFMNDAQEKELNKLAEQFYLDKQKLRHSITHYDFKGYLDKAELSKALTKELPFLERKKLMDKVFIKIQEWLTHFKD